MNDLSTDKLRKFMLDRSHVRGEWVHLDDTWQELLTRADYPPLVRQILGEALTAAVLLSATIKHDGTLILQIRGTGPIHLLVVQATAEGTVRGLAQWNAEASHYTLPDLFGDAQMAITLESKNTGERYQSLIPLEGDSLAQALENYFMRSEQLATRLWLSSNAFATAGLLLQRLPQEHTSDEDWQRASTLLDTLTTEELMQLAPEQLLYRLFHEEQPRLFDAKAIRFHCGCSRERIQNVLQSLGETEVQAILAERNTIDVVCEFCNAHYCFDSIDAQQLFKPTMPASDTLH